VKPTRRIGVSYSKTEEGKVMKIKYHFPVILLLLLVVVAAQSLWTTPVSAGNLHLIEQLPNGFAIYRSGKPRVEDLDRFKRLGITEIAVLSGNAEKHELKHREVYPELEVVYNEKQTHRRLPDETFLDWFDQWVEDARQTGKKIAFRCNCGCHRTGRLAAYYQMRWQNLTYEDAAIIMKKHGRRMFFYPHLFDQVKVLEERARAPKPESPVEETGRLR
jgi:protein-tyrosine phosphatase